MSWWWQLGIRLCGNGTWPLDVLDPPGITTTTSYIHHSQPPPTQNTHARHHDSQPMCFWSVLVVSQPLDSPEPTWHIFEPSVTSCFLADCLCMWIFHTADPSASPLPVSLLVTTTSNSITSFLASHIRTWSARCSHSPYCPLICCPLACGDNTHLLTLSTMTIMSNYSTTLPTSLMKLWPEPKPSHFGGPWLGLSFCKAQAAQSWAKAMAFRLSWAIASLIANANQCYTIVQYNTQKKSAQGHIDYSLPVLELYLWFLWPLHHYWWKIVSSLLFISTCSLSGHHLASIYEYHSR